MPEESDPILAEVFPYPRGEGFHQWACLFVNMPMLAVDAETAHRLAVWVFDSLGCGGPGSAGPPTVKYDALGGSGAPHEYGVWIPVDAERVAVEVTTPDKELTEMDEAEIAEFITNAQAALVAKRAGTAKGA